MADLTRDERARLRELEAKATKGPWKPDGQMPDDRRLEWHVDNEHVYEQCASDADPEDSGCDCYRECVQIPMQDDLSFLAAARNALIPLLDALDAAEKRVAELEETPTVSAIGEAPVDLMQKQRDRWRFVAEWLLEQIKGGEELRAVTTDVAKLTQERDEAKALHADLQATNIAMQADREHLHKRIEGLKADFDEAIQQRDAAQQERDWAKQHMAEAVKRAEAAEKRVAELEKSHDFGVMQVGETVTHITKCPTCGTQVSLSATVAPIGDDHWKRVAEWLLDHDR